MQVDHNIIYQIIFAAMILVWYLNRSAQIDFKIVAVDKKAVELINKIQETLQSEIERMQNQSIFENNRQYYQPVPQKRWLDDFLDRLKTPNQTLYWGTKK